MNLFGLHHIRASYYFLGLIVTIVAIILESFGTISTSAALYITVFFIVTDFIAEMYDPHPSNPGPWFKAHFHRLWDNKES